MKEIFAFLKTLAIVFVFFFAIIFIGGYIVIMWSGLQFLYPPVYAGEIWIDGVAIGMVVGFLSAMFVEWSEMKYHKKVINSELKNTSAQ